VQRGSLPGALSRPDRAVRQDLLGSETEKRPGPLDFHSFAMRPRALRPPIRWARDAEVSPPEYTGAGRSGGLRADRLSRDVGDILRGRGDDLAVHGFILKFVGSTQPGVSSCAPNGSRGGDVRRASQRSTAGLASSRERRPSGLAHCRGRCAATGNRIEDPSRARSASDGNCGQAPLGDCSALTRPLHCPLLGLLL
jgi:hypothetical protein